MVIMLRRCVIQVWIRRLFGAIAAVSMLWTSAVYSLEGLELAQKVYDRPDGNDATSFVKMILTAKGKPNRERELYLFTIDQGGGERLSLMRFSAPADVEDTGLLTEDHAGDDSQQWLYLPALDRVRRISSSRKGGRFVGSDFFYEDLRDREPNMDTHKITGVEKVAKLDCYVLESTPVDKKNSVYRKRVSWVHKDTLIPLKVEYYGKRGDKPIKRLQARKLQKIQGYWTVLNSTMFDLKTGHKTLLATQRLKYDQGLPEELFSRRGLSDSSQQQKYLP